MSIVSHLGEGLGLHADSKKKKTLSFTAISTAFQREPSSALAHIPTHTHIHNTYKCRHADMQTYKFTPIQMMMWVLDPNLEKRHVKALLAY